MIRWTTSGIVLKTEAAGESDQRVEFLTPGHGRLRALAKGAMRSRKRFSGRFDLGERHRVGFLVSGRGGGVLIEHAVVEEWFPRFREDWRRLARLAVFLELAGLTVGEGEPIRRFFALFHRGLLRLHEDPDNDRWSVVYAFRLLSEAGYRPELRRCVRCLSGDPGRDAVFSPAAGGILCSSCRDLLASGPDHDPLAMPLAPETRRTLAAVISATDPLLPRFLFSRSALGQSKEALDRFTRHHLDRPLRSLSFLLGAL